jgi:DNA topoisomerase-3
MARVADPVLAQHLAGLLSIRRRTAGGSDADAHDEEALKQKCPICGSAVKKRDGRFGVFYSCGRYPQCDGKVDGKPSHKRK